MDISVVTAILVITVVLLVTEKVPVDLTAIGIMVTLIVTGILSPRQAVAGFAHPAPLTVGALFIVSRGLSRTGSLRFLTDTIISFSKGRQKPVLLICLVAAGTLSAFVNNTPVVILFVTVVLAVSGRFDLSPSKFLIPVSFISILAGTTTLIGTSTNIIVSDLAAQAGLAPIGMFELMKVGAPLTVIGGAILFFFSSKLLPETHTPIYHERKGKNDRYISELVIPADSPYAGEDVVESFKSKFPHVKVHEVVHGDQVCYPETDDCTLRGNDLVLVNASAGDLVNILSNKSAILSTGDGSVPADPHSRNCQVVEVILPPGSPLIGRKLSETFLADSDNLYVLGVQRRRTHYAEQKMSALKLKVGDILLLQADSKHFARFRAEGELIVVEDMVQTLENRRKAPVALVIFTGMIAAAALGVAGILTCAFTAAFLMLAAGCLTLRDGYSAVDVPVLLLIIGTLSLGTALHQTGAAGFYATGFLSLFHGAGPRAILIAMIVLTSLLSHVLSNNSTAVLLMPIGFSVAAALGVDPRPFVIGICFGASACFATPIGYQTNLLVYGPGGYRFKDYFILGMMLNGLVWIGAAILVPMFWPF